LTTTLSQNAIQILQHIQIAEPQHPETFPLQIVSTQPVFLQACFVIVLTTVELDHQHQLRAVEVQHVGWQRMLSPKLETGQLPVAQSPPEQAFALGEVGSQLLGELELCWIGLWLAHSRSL